MKNLFIIGGTMGIGKSTVSQILKQKLPDSVFLDGDWCWDSSPFQVTAETKKMVLQNICAVLNNFLKCSAYKNVIFCWVMHEQSIIDAIVSCLDTADCRIISVSLTCSEKELVQRLQKDVAAGIRTPDVIERSIQRIPLYQKLNTIKINTSGKSAAEVPPVVGMWAYLALLPALPLRMVVEGPDPQPASLFLFADPKSEC